MIRRRFTTLAVGLLPAFAAHSAADRLLLSEIVVAPTPAEMVAVYNPNGFTVDLSNYYLADYETYYNTVLQTAPATSDFVARFPSGSTIWPNQTQFIAVQGAECFRSACGTVGAFVGYGVHPTYEIASSTAVNNSPDIPDMLMPFPGAIGMTRTLTNTGEPVMLFYWDGTSDLVTDVDYAYYGVPSGNQPVVEKTGVVINGSHYLDDSPDDPARRAPLGSNATTTTSQTCRALPYTEGTQTSSGGNGVGGADETSENTATTWYACTSPTPAPHVTSSDVIFFNDFEPFLTE